MLSGGSLLVGSAGRTDLQGPGRMTGMSIDQYASLQRLAQLPDDVRVLPTHGAGSFCVAGTSDAERTSTIGRERQDNPYPVVPDADGFRQFMAPRLGRFPDVLPARGAPESHGSGAARRDHGATAPHPRRGRTRGPRGRASWWMPGTDGRSAIRSHPRVPMNVEPTASFGTWVAAVVPFGAPIVLVTESSSTSHLRDLAVQLWRVGFERWSATSRAAWTHGRRAVGPSSGTTS